MEKKLSKVIAMEDLKERLLEKLKKLKGITDEKADDVLLFALETAIYDVLHYCNLEIDEFPEALDNTTILIAIDLLREGGFLLSEEEQAEGNVKALKEGDFSITRVTNAEVMEAMNHAPSFSRRYKRNLNRFRRLAR